MIYLTGDTHGGSDAKKLASNNFLGTIKEGDFLIICGDFGFIWDYKKETSKEKDWLDWFGSKPWTTLFIDGNHECFPRIYAYPVEERYGGKVHVIRPNLLHMMRGQMFELEGKKIFALGGASSHDRGPIAKGDKGSIGKYWWYEELPNDEEYAAADQTLQANDYKMDYIITHCLPSDKQTELKKGAFKPDRLTDYLQDLQKKATYTHWYCGHYHVDTDVGDNISVIFNNVIPIGTTQVQRKPVLGSPVFNRYDPVRFVLEGAEYEGKVTSIFPRGFMKIKDQPVYDIEYRVNNVAKHARVPETDIIETTTQSR